MFSFAHIDKHAKLKDRMTDTLGIDTVEELQRGQMSEMEFVRSVQRCQSCSDAEDCASWLDAHADGTNQAPDFCRNQALFDRLTKG